MGALGLPTATPSASATQAATTTVGLPTATPSAPAGVEAIIIQTVGTNLRPEANDASLSTTALDWNTVHTAIGRSADNAWVQLVSADGDTGWVSANAVMVTGGLNALPIVQ